MSGFWDGSFTDYGTAIGTVGLALITTISVLREAQDRKILRAERDAARGRAEQLEADERARKDEEQRRQAEPLRRIPAESVWCYQDAKERDAKVVITTTGGAPPAGRDLVECAVVQNMGDKPIRDVEIGWYNAAATDISKQTPVDFGGLLPVVPALGSRAVMRPESMSTWHRTQLILAIRFTDINGVRWMRREDGRLTEIAAST